MKSFASLLAALMMNVARAVALIAPTLLIGCTTPYRPELTGKPTARLRATSDFPILAVAGYLKNGCLSTAAISWDMSTEPLGPVGTKPSWVAPWVSYTSKAIGMPAPPDDPTRIFVEQTIPAGQPFGVGFHASNAGSGYGMTCATGVVFNPEPGADYVVHFTRTTVDFRPGCTVRAGRLVLNDGRVAHERIPDLKAAPNCPLF